VVAAIAVVLAVAWPEDPAQSGWLVAARADDLAVNEPLAIDGAAYLVRLDTGEILALSRVDPHLGCSVPFRPQFEFMGHTGWFRNPCHGETYDVTGVCYAGPCPRGLDRYDVRVRDGIVEVDFTHLREGPPRSADEDREPVTPG
jgi:nitrite reductase/ring-hydroxylating ferredoxin subunit